MRFLLTCCVMLFATGCISYKCNQTTFNATATGAATDGTPAITQEMSGDAVLEAATDISPKLTAKDNTIPIK